MYCTEMENSNATMSTKDINVTTLLLPKYIHIWVFIDKSTIFLDHFSLMEPLVHFIKGSMKNLNSRSI